MILNAVGATLDYMVFEARTILYIVQICNTMLGIIHHIFIQCLMLL